MFLAHALSLLGVVVSEIALTVLVYELTGSPLLSALVFALGFLPYLVGGTLLSGVADRFPPRRVLVVCDLVCAGCAALMALPATPVAALLVLRCVIAAVSPVFSGTRMATLTDILGDGDLFVLGRSLLRIVSQSAVLVGFGLGGVLLTVVSAARGTGRHAGHLPRLGAAPAAGHAAPAGPGRGRGVWCGTRSPAPGRSWPTAGSGRCCCSCGCRRCSSWRRRRWPPRTRTRPGSARPGSGC